MEDGTFDLSGITVRVRGAPADLAARLHEAWAAFAVAVPALDRPMLEVGVIEEAAPPPAAPFAPKQIEARFAPGRASFTMPEGRASVDGAGGAEIVLARLADRSRELYALVNLLRACLAWALPARGALLVHAAALVLEGRAFLLVGPEGAGKSTWVRLGEAAGGRAITDDLALVDTADPAVLGAPFRSTHRTELRPGRWPLAAVLLARHGPAPALEPVTALEATATLTANLPFLDEAAGDDPRVAAAVDALARRRPMRLTFTTDSGFVDLLRRLPA